MPDVASMTFRCPSSVSALVKAAAERAGISASQWLLRASESALRAEGFAVANQQYALVRDGQFVPSPSGHAVIITFKPWSDDRGEWLPIENEDDQPFDASMHWRLKPLPLRVDGDRCVRTYPVIEKFQEHA